MNRNRPSAPIAEGFLFIDGEYIDPPYALELQNDRLMLNGLETNISAARLSKDLPAEDPQMRRWNSFGGTKGAYSLRIITDKLHSGEVVLLFSDAPPLSASNIDGAIEILRALSDDSSKEELIAREQWDFIANYEDPDQWKAFLANFDSTPALVSRATAKVAEFDQVAHENETHMRAMQRLNQWAYPLTLTGMVLVVAAFGHLLSSAPRRSDQKASHNERTIAVRALFYSLGLVVALSALDFVWTLLNSQAGQMREMNPLAQGMIDQPMQLMAFKITITAAAIGIMLLLRRYRPAQVGAWWACLICTLLTARWLVLNSLMV